MRTIGERIAKGVVAGAVATAFMSAAMWAAQRAGLLGEMPPRKVARTLLSRVRGRSKREVEKPLAVLVHFAVGGGAGALYGIFASPRPTRLSGLSFGVLVCATGYLGLLFKVGIMPPPGRDRPMRPTTMIVAHLVYGYFLSATRARL